jgi:alpha-galactosidase
VPKIVLIGAGSVSFGFRTLCDLFTARKQLRGATIVLVDTDEDAVRLIARVAHRLNEAAGTPFAIETTVDRREALPGAQFVIISVAVRRNETWRLDFEIPLKHGAKQVLGENGGPGGLFHAMRNIPIVLAICRDIERLCPGALVLNFSNPEGRLCLAATRYTDLQFVGLCHGIGMTQAAVAGALGLEPRDVDPLAAGLNHFTWVLEMRRSGTGENLYPAFREAVERRDIETVGAPPSEWRVVLCRYLMRTFGLWPSPSDDHVGEYLAYAWEYCGLEGYDFGAADRLAAAQVDRLRRLAEGDEPVGRLLDQRSAERAIPIILGVLGSTHQYELAVNVPNGSLIPNLPEWAVVEVPAIVDASGVHGVAVRPLPEPIAAMCGIQVAVADRAVEAGVHGDRRAALQALLLDPVIQSAAQAEAILEEMLDVHCDLLPQFRVASPT